MLLPRHRRQAGVCLLHCRLALVQAKQAFRRQACKGSVVLADMICLTGALYATILRYVRLQMVGVLRYELIDSMKMDSS